MPKELCKCGQFLDLGAIPNPGEWLLIADVDYDRYTGPVDAETLYADMKSMLVCPHCGRLLVYWQGFGNGYTAYRPEE
ncbi:hypothetical protein I2I05_17460 [Hymenobacter sp. BT683]|uniref:CPXCG motif-containing cysteine-rich protein n=1 Tax=Hymenobacter jeongseonensis TaxID=2791027 RepID=A0ABS0ILG9_9BACT|nr:hypothetical protein [Hymenobacter jeongseonensis]MBF9239196.1 hypothetical protein [Hymenobacter jeongseonensis]